MNCAVAIVAILICVSMCYYSWLSFQTNSQGSQLYSHIFQYSLHLSCCFVNSYKSNNDDDVLSAPIGDDDDDDGGWMTGWLTVSLNGCFISCYSLTFLVLLQLRPKCFFSFGYLARNILNCLLLYIFFIYILKNFSLLHWSHESSARLLTRTQFGNCLLALLPLYHHKHRLVYR